jgi:gliding motility-associated-like protein
MKHIYITGFFLHLILASCLSYSQITVTTGTPVNTLVQNVLVGQGVTVTNVTYTGHPNAIGHFTTGANPTNLGLSEGIILSTGIVNDTWGPIGSAASNMASTNNGTAGQSQLTALAGYTTYDAAILEFDFMPLSDTIEFRYVFGSEEYHEYVNSGFNDVFAFFISGPNPLGGVYTDVNIAKIPGTNTPVSIDNVNNGNHFTDCAFGPCTNCAYFVDNCYGTSVVYDAFTVVLTAWAAVIPCMTYHLKLGIADAGDGILDSGVFLEANSFTSNAVALTTSVSVPAMGNDAIEGCNDAIIEFTLPAAAPSNHTIPFSIGGTATNGVDYQAIPTSVTIPAGQTSTTLTINPIYDGIPEPIETVVLTVQTSACFTETVSINILDYTEVEATGTGSTSFCAGGGPATIGVDATNGMQPYSYAWSNGLPATQTHSVDPLTTTTYTVTVSDACGFTATADVTVTISADADINIIPDDPSMCVGSTVSLTATGGISYNWSSGQSAETITVSPPSSTTYSVSGTDANGCTGTAEVTVLVYDNLTVTISPSNPDICEGDDMPLSAVSNGISPAFSWDSGQDTSDIIVTPTITTTYIVNVIDSAGCTGSAQTIVNVNPVPVVDFQGFPLEGCVPVTVNFSNLGSTGDMLWQFGDGATSTMISPSHNYNSSGLFTVSLTISAAGCENTLTMPDYVHIYPQPLADFHPSETIIYEDAASVSFTDLSLGATSWLWDFGTGTSDGTSFIQNPEYTFPGVGDYIVWLYVENEWGCTDSTFREIIVKPMITFYIPNAFSPNEDGINDLFMPFGNNVDPDHYQMIIYDRWGKQLFRTDNLNTPWNGTSSEYNGKVVPQGVYVYLIKATFDGITKIYEGTVMLVY